ncbi:MAG: hypothetical protein A2622_13230 [Bdellovibrionales bacterium RIFCSPHIGHO2_01_FULL_40_29]|nr:MAG: hypothetical protein A2622_13230 [Bdellovibrionales bacterium RIFCSPHIGHO2_01_FULL_40_29]OFZ33349.1 MAG: hypothetical protein A3D17_13655 [Bdellovibrionales bacterium RIFCSPHIGHO2_02_FULL_40_15]
MKSIFSALAFLLITTTVQADCVNIYYDRGPVADYWMGKTYANFVQNLLGHFPHLDQKLGAIEDYRAGQIDECRATIYIASYFENKIPDAFFQDYKNTTKNVAWLGYSIWKFGPAELEKMFGIQYLQLTQMDSEKLDLVGQPSFYRTFQYKGEEFEKFGEFSATPPYQFVAAYEMAMMKETIPGKSQWLATAKHSAHQGILPYVLRAENKFYVADVPFSFMHESDRYLIFTDLLFDILNEKPRHTKKMGFLRVEDVHPVTPLNYLYNIQKVLKDEKVPMHVSLIPLFFDPLYRTDRAPTEEFIPMDRHVAFMNWIREAQSEGARFIWHGVTHQLGRQKNPHDGISGSDFEFWDATANKPLGFDNSSWLLNRMREGLYTLNKSKIEVLAWLTPHYQASSLDYIIFGKIFQWNVGRVIYYNHAATAMAPTASESDLWLKDMSEAQHQHRLDYFKNLNVTIESDRWSGQIFPYEIFGDIYGQRLIPENLGNSQPFKNAHVVRTRSVQQMVRDAKRNLVIRDAWASFFYHPFLFDSFESGGRGFYPGDPTELKLLITEIKKLGYEFIDLKDFIKTNTAPKRKETVIRK